MALRLCAPDGVSRSRTAAPPVPLLLAVVFTTPLVIILLTKGVMTKGAVTRVITRAAGAA